MDNPPTRMDAETCRSKAAECRALARLANRDQHQIMLLHMADTWDRIAETYAPRDQ